MAHEVQIGKRRWKVRNPAIVLVLGLVSLGFYLTYWWIRTAKDLEQIDREENQGRARANASLSVKCAVVGTAGYALTIIATLYMISRARAVMEISAARRDTPVETSILLKDAMDGPMMLIGILGWIVLICLVVAGRHMRTNFRNTMASIGMLPEEQNPGTFAYILCCLVPGVIAYVAIQWAGAGVLLGMAIANQYSMKAILERYPRYFASIGGTREEVTEAQTSLATVRAAHSGIGGAPAAQPSNVVALPVRSVTMPPPQLSPAAQRMQQLEPGARAGVLSHAESYEYAQVSEQVHGPEAAAPWYAYVVQTDPSNALAAFWYGVFQLGQGDDAGVATLHRTLADQRTAPYARQRIVAYLQSRGRHDEAARYLQPTAAAA